MFNRILNTFIETVAFTNVQTIADVNIIAFMQKLLARKV